MKQNAMIFTCLLLAVAWLITGNHTESAIYTAAVFIIVAMKETK